MLERLGRAFGDRRDSATLRRTFGLMLRTWGLISIYCDQRHSSEDHHRGYKRPQGEEFAGQRPAEKQRHDRVDLGIRRHAPWCTFPQEPEVSTETHNRAEENEVCD